MKLKTNIRNPGVSAAWADLERDLKITVPREAVDGWVLSLALSDDLAAETFVLDVTDDRQIQIQAGDALGAIYGVYEISHRFLGVDPLWFWKDVAPAAMDDFAPAPQRIESGGPAFRYRGWFINDEDLLGLWKPAAGQRFLDWPKREEYLDRNPDDKEVNYESRLLEYYSPILPTETMEMIFEAALRLRANLIIPASFIDIMNEPEADVIRAAIRRGFFVSQHHVEPLGVSHFAYETWWHRQGRNPEFSYMQDPAAMRACWHAFAERWAEVAGDKLIWQVGLRGRGDRALWCHDPAAKDRAGELIAAALDEQMSIIRSVDPRPQPPATLTLWLEGAELIRDGKLRAPEGITYVFADHYLTQEMQEDFHVLPREAGRDHGFYYHIAVWGMGPHLVQSPPPEKISRSVCSVAARGDTYYAILNVANIREHVMGATVWTEQVWRPEPLTDESFLSRWSSPELAPLHAEFLACIAELAPGWRFSDGGVRTCIDRLITEQAEGIGQVELFDEYLNQKRDHTRRTVLASIDRLADLITNLRNCEPAIDPRWQNFSQHNLLVQATILDGLYRALMALISDPPDYPTAIRVLERVLETCAESETGRWEHWYRGDKKVGIARLRNRIEDLHTHPTEMSF